MPSLRKSVIDIRCADGLGQKFDPRTLPVGKSASAINLVKNKQGRLDKRLGLKPLSGVDPYGSGFLLSAGVNLGTWNAGGQDSLVVVGRGARPTFGSMTATALETYSDALGGMVLRGPIPDIKITGDKPIVASTGAAVSPCLAVSGGIAVKCWIDTAADLSLFAIGGGMLAQPPSPQVGQLMWCAFEAETGNVISGPAPVDTMVGQYTQFVRLDVVNGTFIVCYSCASVPPGTDSNGVIYAKTIALSDLETGSGGSLPDWTPNIRNAALQIVTNNAGQSLPLVYGAVSPAVALGGGAFDMRAAGGDTNFVLAYATGTWNPPGTGPGFWSGIEVVADKRPIANPTASPVLFSAGSAPDNQSPTAFGVRANAATGHIVVAWSLPAINWQTLESGSTYTILAAAGVYPGMGAYNTATTIYTSTGPVETPPTWLDVSYCGTPAGLETYVESHSPSGSCWLPAFAPTSLGNLATASTTVTSFVLLASYTASNPGWNGGSGYNGYGSSPYPLPITFTGGTFTRAASGYATIGGSLTGYAIVSVVVTDGGIYTAGSAPTGVSLDFPNTGSGFSFGASPATTEGVQAITITNGGSGYDPSFPPSISFSGGSPSTVASWNAMVDPSTGAVVSTYPTSVPGGWGAGYSGSPTISIAAGKFQVTGLMQGAPNRVGMPGDPTNTFSLWYPENGARIIQNQFHIVSNPGSPIGTWIPTCGSTNPITGANSCITPGVVLASRGCEANGIVYFLGWVPSSTQGTFVVLAFDLAGNPVTVEGLTGNGFPMRWVGTLQTRTANADPGWGFQTNPNPSPFQNFQTTLAPNGWTGGSFWYDSGDGYSTKYVGYITSSNGERVSPAYGTIEFAPRQGYMMAPWDNLLAIGGAVPSLFDGQNVFEQSFLYTIESVVATPVVGGGIEWTSDTDSYSWIFTWEQFDALGNLHISARSNPVTITGADLVGLQPTSLAGGFGPTIQSFSSGAWVGGIAFRVPTLGVTNRQWPLNTAPGFRGINGPFGNDLRAFASQPAAPIVLGTYRTEKNGQVYTRVYDRTFNRDDIGDPAFLLLQPPLNGFVQSYDATDGYQNQAIGWIGVIDDLFDNLRTNPATPFPPLYGDGTDGAPGNVDNFCGPSTAIMVRHKERLFIARGNQVLYTKTQDEETSYGPAFNEQVQSFFVGASDDIIGMASQDGNLIILKANQNYSVSGNGPDDTGSNGQFDDPQPIPTDAGCVDPGSIIPTPEGVYYMSDAGLRLIDRSLQVRYVGGPVEDELLEPLGTITGSVLYPNANRVLFCNNDLDVPINVGLPPGVPDQLFGEVLSRDYFLDAWTTFVVNQTSTTFLDVRRVYNWQVGFVTGIAATAPVGETALTRSALHLLAADGTVWRESSTFDAQPYYDGGPGAQYVVSVWTSPMIRPPSSQEQSESLQGRFRLWDINALISPQDPHGLIVSVAIDYGELGVNRTWVWNSTNTPPLPSIAPGGTTPAPLEQLRTYDGRMGEAFQVSIQDVADIDSSTGQGAQLLGLTLAIGTYPGPYKLAPGSTQ